MIANYYMVLYVLHDTGDLDDILAAWENAGARGITILPSTGLGRIRQSALREDLPLIPSLHDIMGQVECLNQTIFTIIQDQGMIDKIVAATETVTGSLSNPDTGILCVLPLQQVYGLNHRTDKDA